MTAKPFLRLAKIPMGRIPLSEAVEVPVLTAPNSCSACADCVEVVELGTACSAGANSTHACFASSNIASSPPQSGQFIQSLAGAAKTFLANDMRRSSYVEGEYSIPPCGGSVRSDTYGQVSAALGRAAWLLRSIPSPTRWLHPSADQARRTATGPMHNP